MEEVIKRIIGMEEKARNVVDSAEREKKDKYEDMENRIAALKEKLDKDSEAKLARLREKELMVAKEEVNEKYEGCNGQIRMIEQYYLDNKKDWCDMLYKQVIKR